MTGLNTVENKRFRLLHSMFYFTIFAATGFILEAGAVGYCLWRAPAERASAAAFLGSIGLVAGLLSIILGRRCWRSLDHTETCLRLLGEGNPVAADSYISEKRDRLTTGVRDAVLPVLDTFFRLIGNMQRSSDELSYLVDLLKKGIESNRKGLSEVSRAMSEVAAAADEEAGAAQRVAESIEILNALAQDITDTAANAKKMAREADLLVHEVEQKMHLLLTDIRQATVANEETAQKVAKLAGQMEQVNRFVETLTGIAEQTNLLALNAAIEAARAGDTGRGFAVVADEIRKLATGSAESALEIVSLARGIREKAEEAAGEVSDRVSLVQGNLEKGEEVVCSMRRLSEAFSEVVRALDIIGSKVEEQANKLQAINHEAGRVAAVSEQAAASFEEVTASAAEQSAATQRMEDHVNRLVIMAGRFQDLANQYTRESWDKETRERLVQEGLKVLSNLAENPDIKSLRVERLAGVFDKTFQSCSFLKTPLLVGVDGRVIYTNFQVDKNMDWSFRPWFQGALRGERFVGQPYVTLNTNRPAITLSCPVKEETGEVIAVLAANVDKM